MKLLFWRHTPVAQDARSATERAGTWGEEFAARLLRRKGFKIIGRRVRIGRRDELDIVARDGRELVFVEVKTRATEKFGEPLTAVDRAKRHALSRAAVRYLKRLSAPEIIFRFDVVEVIGRPDAEKEPIVRHVPNAFQLDRQYRVP